MPSEDLVARVAVLEARLRTMRFVVVGLVVAGRSLAAWTISAVGGVLDVVSPGERVVTVREVRSLFGDERDGEFRERPPALTASWLSLGDDRDEFVHIAAASSTPIRVASSRGVFEVSDGQGPLIALRCGEAW